MGGGVRIGCWIDAHRCCAWKKHEWTPSLASRDGFFEFWSAYLGLEVVYHGDMLKRNTIR